MKTGIYELLEKISTEMEENKIFLTELDGAIGDADHGINMARGFKAVVEMVPQDEDDIGVVLKKTGMTLLSKVGGASGPLYGTAFMKAAGPFNGKTEVTAEDLLGGLNAALEGIKYRGKATTGEKTMVDALEPAINAFESKMNDGGSLEECLAVACEEAEKGVEYTKTIIATKGRASYLGERSIGHQDPGATSATMMLKIIRDHVQDRKTGVA